MKKMNGHQDDRIGPLTLLKTLNCNIDSLDKDFAIKYMGEHTVLFNPVTLDMGSIYCQGGLVISGIKYSIYSSALHTSAVVYLSSTLNILVEVLTHDTAWKYIIIARKDSNWNTYVLVTKWLSRDTVTCRIILQRKKNAHLTILDVMHKMNIQNI